MSIERVSQCDMAILQSDSKPKPSTQQIGAGTTAQDMIYSLMDALSVVERYISRVDISR